MKPTSKGGTDKKRLAPGKKAAIKGKIEKDSAREVARTVLAVRRIRQNSTDAFGALTILDGPIYVSFPRPVGGTRSRGCKSAQVVLGPLVGWPEPQLGTDAEAKYPSAIIDVKKQIDNGKYHWKSGHVINADFGGYGKSNENMTCLTSSANTSQTAFDNNIKKARSSLHKVYRALRLAGLRDDFFADLRYGIEIKIEMSDDAWGDTYPHNCVSNTMSLRATILNAPTEASVRDAPGQPKKTDIQQVLGYIREVQNFVDTANRRDIVKNEK